MVDSTNASVLDIAVDDLKSYVTSNYGASSTGSYFSVLNELRLYAVGDDRKPAEIVAEFYEIATSKPLFQRPDKLRSRRPSSWIGYQPTRRDTNYCTERPRREDERYA